MRLKFEKVFVHVSIRAPVRGATCLLAAVFGVTFVSIRAPVRGATMHDAMELTAASLFRSAPPCGGRPWG